MEKTDNPNRDELLEKILIEAKASELDPESVAGVENEPAPADQAKTETATPVAGKKRETRKPSSFWADLAALLLRIGWIGLIVAILLLVICGVTVNSGDRMAPAFHDRDVVIYYRLAKDIQAGEVVAYHGEHGKVLLGRVVAKAGDRVDIDENGLRINGYYQTEPYMTGETVVFEGGVALPVTLRAGEYFVLCDDRDQAPDSRTLGPISSDRILGRVMLTIRQRDF